MMHCYWLASRQRFIGGIEGLHLINYFHAGRADMALSAFDVKARLLYLDPLVLLAFA